jgi:hypothetical protein
LRISLKTRRPAAQGRDLEALTAYVTSEARGVKMNGDAVEQKRRGPDAPRTIEPPPQ